MTQYFDTGVVTALPFWLISLVEGSVFVMISVLRGLSGFVCMAMSMQFKPHSEVRTCQIRSKPDSVPKGPLDKVFCKTLPGHRTSLRPQGCFKSILLRRGLASLTSVTLDILSKLKTPLITTLTKLMKSSLACLCTHSLSTHKAYTVQQWTHAIRLVHPRGALLLKRSLSLSLTLLSELSPFLSLWWLTKSSFINSHFKQSIFHKCAGYKYQVINESATGLKAALAKSLHTSCARNV